MTDPMSLRLRALYDRAMELQNPQPSEAVLLAIDIAIKKQEQRWPFLSAETKSPR